MKQLLLLRHAKSSWDDPALADFDRPLALRGRKDAQRMGREIAVRGWLPQRALVSPAARTRETWEIVSAEWPAFPKYPSGKPSTRHPRGNSWPRRNEPRKGSACC